MNFFVKDFCETVQARIVIFGMQVDNDVFIPPLRNRGGYTGLHLSVLPSVRPSVSL